MRIDVVRVMVPPKVGRLAVACALSLCICVISLGARAGSPPDAGPTDAGMAEAGPTDAGARDGADASGGAVDAATATPTITCPELSGISATYPADGATNVPRNTVVRVRYGPSATMSGIELITLRDGSGSLVGGVVTNDVRELVLAPTAPLLPGTYTAAAPALDGTSSTVFTFTVSDVFDDEAPSVGPSEAIDWDAVEIEQVCDVPSGVRYEMRIRPGALADDRGAEHLELRVFRVGDPGTPPREVERLPARLAADEVAVRLPQNQALGEVCFALAARDLPGAIGVGTDRVCFHTIALPFWDGCSVAAPGSRGERRAWMAPFLVLAIATSIGARIRRRRAGGAARG